jgi:AsmA protein
LSLSLDEADFVREAVSAVVDVQGRGSLRGDSLEISSLNLTLPGLRAEGRLEVKEDSGTLGFSGEVAAKPIDPRRLLKLLRPELLEALPQGAFSQASVAFRFSGTPHALKIPQLQTVLDRSQLNAQVDLSSLRPAKGTFQVNVNELDLDRFLPAASAPAETKAASSSPLQAGTSSKKSSGRDPMLVIPPEIDVSGTVAVDVLKAAKLTLSQVKALMAVKNGRLTVQPFQADLYGGSLTGTLGLSANGQGPRGDISYDLTNVAIGALLRDLQGKESLTGTAAVKGRTAFAGANADAVKRSLSGTTQVRVTDGSYRGVNIPRMIREAKAAVQGRKLEPGEEEAATDFTELTATLVMKSGVVRNDDLSAKSPYLRLEGRGTVDLPAEAVDYLLTTTLVAVPRGQSGEDLEDLMGVPIPIRIHGPLGKPRYALDMKAVLEAAARGKVKEKVEAVEEKLKEKLEKKVPGLKGLDLKKLF